MNTVMGVDLGTQSLKVIIYDFESKKIVDEKSCSLELISKEDGTKEQKAQWWLDAFKECVLGLDGKIRKSILAIGVSGQQHGFVPLDKSGNVIYNVKLWCDTSTTKECDEITEKMGGEDNVFDEVGNLILPGYTISKILWLKKNKPELYDKLDCVLLPHDYLNYYLTGEKIMEYGDASGTGLMNVKKREWSRRLADTIDKNLIDKLPELVGSDDLVGNINKKLAEELGLSEVAIISAGGGDNMMGAIGTGSVEEGSLTASLGTSGTLYGYSDKPVVHKDLAGFCSSTNGWLPLICTMNCTIGLELTKKLLNKEIGEIEELVAASEVGSNGIITLPFYNGERAPNLPNGKGCMIGMNMNNLTEGNVLRSSMEAAIFGLRYGLDVFKKVGFDAKEVRLTGGGAKSATWRQIVADVLDLPVIVPEIQEGAAIGAALQALWTLANSSGNKCSIADIVAEHITFNEDNTHLPNQNAVKKYEQIFNEYLKYLNILKPEFV
jgi:xylulokinase